MWKGMDGLALENGVLKAAWQSFCMAEPQLERGCKKTPQTKKIAEVVRLQRFFGIINYATN